MLGDEYNRQRLIKQIDEHTKKAGGWYGLELPDSDLKIIREALELVSYKAPVNKPDAFGDTTACCPNCGKPVINYFNKAATPANCMFCGQRVEPRE